MDDDAEEVDWKGCSMQEIYRNLNEWELKHVPPVRPSDVHTVLYHFPIRKYDQPPKPFKGQSRWDAFHVRLPCSPKSQYPVTKSDGSVAIESRWEMIEKALLRPIKNSQELEIAIKSYNSKYENVWNFHSLHKLFEEELDEDATNSFFEDLLPKIIRLALRLPELIHEAIPLLKQEENRSISLSQQQVACLLANAFLCTYPRRNTMKKKSEYSTFPDINFNRLFQSTGHQIIEKIKCIFHYFKRVCNNPPLGVITMTRRYIFESELPKWSECNAPLGVTPLHITSAGTIEDQGKGLLQVDFANKYLGGGVLGSGCVQEEIRFVICPELIISKLFTEALRPNECLSMIGCEQFSKYSGYAGTFTWDGNFVDNTPFDDSRRRQCHIVAIDALYFVQSSHQYREEYMFRELNKAYVGFFHSLETPAPGVASGNWGCGAFGGEATLKALLQLMACTVTKRPLVYFTFGNCELRDAIHNIHTFFIENNVTVKQLWRYLKEFRSHKLLPNDLYSYICQIHRDYKKGPTNSIRESSSNNRRLRGHVKVYPQDKTDAKVVSVCNEGCSSSNGQLPDPVSTEIRSETDSTEISPKDEDDKLCEEVKKELNLSDEDIFASVSTPERNAAESKIRNDTTKEPQGEKYIDKNKKSPQANQLKKPAETRQRSLLEMLDVFYTGSPAKRHCVSGKQNI